MRARAFVIAAVAALLAAASIVWIRARQSRLDTERALAELTSARAQQEDAFQRASSRLAAAGRAHRERELELKELESATPGPQARPSLQTPTKIMSPVRSSREIMASDPTVEALHLRWQRHVIELEYRTFFAPSDFRPSRSKDSRRTQFA